MPERNPWPTIWSMPPEFTVGKLVIPWRVLAELMPEEILLALDRHAHADWRARLGVKGDLHEELLRRRLSILSIHLCRGFAFYVVTDVSQSLTKVEMLE